MRATYRVTFVDANHGGYNQKLLEADCVEDIYAYMDELGHEVISVEVL